MACLNRPATRQSGATCWFHAILNGFITSKYGQVIMYNALAKYMFEHVATKKELEDFISPSLTCVMPGRLHSRFNFYKWLYYWLILSDTSGSRNSRNVMRNLVNAKRNNINERHNNPVTALMQILDRLDIHKYAAFNLVTHNLVSRVIYEVPDFWVFGNDRLLNGTVKQGGFGSELPDVLEAPQYGTGVYRLDHMCIGVKFGDSAGAHTSHAITGIRCKNTGNFMLVDSNIDFLFPCDWRQIDNVTSNQQYAQACMLTYGSPVVLSSIIFVVYVRSNIDLETLNMNKLNIRPEKILQKHVSAMNTSG